MKLQRGVYPDFYQKRQQVEKEDSETFVGREVQMKFFWDELYNHNLGTSKNYAILAQRKMGKTASLTHFFNIAFWEQDEVIPLYYCFKNKKRGVRDVADEMVATWFGQWLGFTFKQPKIAATRNIEVVPRLLQQVEDESLQEDMIFVFDSYMSQRAKCIEGVYGESAVLDKAFEVITSLVDRLQLRCLCIVDEFQELASGVIVDSAGKPIDNPGSIERVSEHGSIWSIVSGSKVSMLYYDAMAGDLNNRYHALFYRPLRRNESDELVRVMIAKYGYENVYKGIEQDVYQVFNGNPFYIIKLFHPTWEYAEIHGKNKNFTNRKELQEIVQFEVAHPEGTIFQFWDKQFRDNAEKLNDAPPNRPGLTYELLRYILDQGEADYQNIQAEFDLDFKQAEYRVLCLRDADLLFSIHDPVLRLVLPQIRHKKFAKSKSETIAPEAQRLFDEEFREMRQQMDNMRKDVDDNTKRSKSTQGDVNRLRGGKLEEAIKNALLAGCGPLNGYRIAGELTKIHVGKPGVEEKEIDLAGTLKVVGDEQSKKGKREKIGLAVEVRNRKNKICKGEAEKFIKAVELYKKQYKLTKVVAILINRNGFSKPVLQMFKKHGIIAANIEDFGLAA